MTAVISPPSAARTIRADLLAIRDQILTREGDPAEITAVTYEPRESGAVLVSYALLRASGTGHDTYAADESVTLLRSAGSRAA